MTLSTLYDSLDRRPRPEDVAQTIQEVLSEDLTRAENALLDRAAKGALKRRVYAYSSMLADFARPVGLHVQVKKAGVIFGSAYALTSKQAASPDHVEAFVRHVGGEIHKAFGRSDFLGDRLNREARRAHGLGGLSRRRYNRMFRHLTRMERKLAKLVRSIRKYEYTRVGKSGLATMLPESEFNRSVNSAAFVAYYAARCNLRSRFTVAGQTKPFDEIAQMLLARCFADRRASFLAVAHVLPRADVLARLTEAEKLQLVNRWTDLMSGIGGLLRETWATSNIERRTMIVRRGNDSSTWNQTANAWNTARKHWIALLHALGMQDVLDDGCPGKVLRLMAADVAAWHRATGGGLSPETEVWNALPLPWEVLSGEARSSRADVLRTARRFGVDAVKTGWVAVPPVGRPVAFRPTPELVHGVSVSSPLLARALRRRGAFSGKPKAVSVSPALKVAARRARDRHRASEESRRSD